MHVNLCFYNLLCINYITQLVLIKGSIYMKNCKKVNYERCILWNFNIEDIEGNIIHCLIKV